MYKYFKFRYNFTYNGWNPHVEIFQISLQFYM
jgi:hypothetical protein